MIRSNHSSIPSLRAIVSRTILFAVAALGASWTWGADLEGFLEPYKTINVASDDSGTIDTVFVKEGEFIDKNKPIAKLQSDVLEALLAIARQNMTSVGRLEAAKADLKLRKDRLEKLEPLRRQGHARQEEIDRAVYETALAEANLQTAQEDLASKRLEYEKIKTQIENRTIKSPIAGFITVLHKEPGEFVAPNNPDILTIVRVDQLLANFTLLGSQSQHLVLGGEIDVIIEGSGRVVGKVEFISPVVNAESGTVLVKVLVDNAELRFRSGQRCRIQIKD
jgi:RND family efflux transporter MFP subunit